MKKRSKKLHSQAHFLKHIPNFLTLCNSLCGFAAILYMLNSHGREISDAMPIFVVAAVMIFSAMIFDVCDGLAARLLNAASLHGIQMDSLADMVTFGVTPAVMIALLSQCLLNWLPTVGQAVTIYLLCSVYLGGAALRLATYNVHATLEKKSSDTFSGLPSPGAAAALCVALFFIRVHVSSDSVILRYCWIALPCFAALLGLLMTSTIPYIHAGKWLMSIRRNRRKLPIILLMVAVIICFKISGLTFIMAVYLLSGPVMLLFDKLFHKKIAAPQVVEEEAQ